jgi:MFS family permease
MAQPSPAESSPARPVVVLAVLAVSVCGYSLAATQLLPALPVLQAHFHSSANATAWVFTAYTLVAAPATPLVGRMGDMYGRRRMLITVLAVFSLASVASAFAHNLPELIAARAVQGLGGAILPLSFGIVRDVLPARRVPVGLALVGAMTAIGGSVGLPLGGLIIDRAPVAVLFWTGAAFGFAGLAGAVIGLPRTTLRAPGRLDVGGALILTALLVALLIGVSFAPRWGWGSARVLGLFAFGAAAAPVWWRYESLAASPLVDTRLLRKRSVTATLVTTLAMGFGLFGTFTLLPRLAQSPVAIGGLGLSPFLAGALMFPTAFINASVAPVVGVIGRVRGSRLPLRTGCLVAAGGLALLSALHASPLEIALGCAVLGVGFACALAAAPNILVNNVGWEQTGAVMAANTLAQNLGSSIGSQVAVTIVVARSVDGNISPGYTWAFAVAAATAALAFLACSMVVESARTVTTVVPAGVADPVTELAPGLGPGVLPAPPNLTPEPLRPFT